jgi:hypothetical protein
MTFYSMKITIDHMLPEINTTSRLELNSDKFFNECIASCQGIALHKHIMLLYNEGRYNTFSNQHYFQDVSICSVLYLC